MTSSLRRYWAKPAALPPTMTSNRWRRALSMTSVVDPPSAMSDPFQLRSVEQGGHLLLAHVGIELADRRRVRVARRSFQDRSQQPSVARRVQEHARIGKHERHGSL